MCYLPFLIGVVAHAAHLDGVDDDQGHQHDQRERRSHTQILLGIEGEVVDELHHGHGGVVRTTLGQNEELIEREDRAGHAVDQAHHDGRLHQRQGDRAEDTPGTGAVHAGRLVQITGDGLQTDHHQQHVVARESPDNHDNRGPQGRLAGGQHRTTLLHQAQRAQNLGDRAHLRGIQGVEQQGRGRQARRGRQQEAGTQHVVPLRALLHNHGHAQTKDQQEDRDDHGVLEREPNRGPEQFVLEHLDEVVREVHAAVATQQAPTRAGHDDQ